MKLRNFLVYIDPVPVDNVNSVLGWLIGIMTAFITGILIYLKTQNTERIEDFKKEIGHLKKKYG